MSVQYSRLFAAFHTYCHNTGIIISWSMFTRCNVRYSIEKQFTNCNSVHRPSSSRTYSWIVNQYNIICNSIIIVIVHRSKSITVIALPLTIIRIVSREDNTIHECNKESSKSGGCSTKKTWEKTYLNFILMARINYNLDAIY